MTLPPAWMMLAGYTFFVMFGGVASAADPFAAHRMVAVKSIDALPAEMAPLFRKHRAEFEHGAVEPGIDWPRDRTLKRYNRWHHVEGDIEASRQTRTDRLSAFGMFPRRQSAAERLYRRHAPHGHGQLPWAIEACYLRLVEAFKSKPAAEIVLAAGHLAHFAADTANPFRSSANDTGIATGNLIIGSSRGVHPSAMYHSVRERFGVGLVDHYTTTYAQALKLSPGRNRPSRNPIDRAWEMIENALSVVDEVALADREIMKTLKITDRRSFKAQKEAYYAAMHNRCGEICRHRLEAAAVMTARLIAGAWQAADEPPLKLILSRRQDDATADKPTANTTMGPFVGSRHSNIFHKPDCPWVRQITQDNRVTFPTALEARRAGRRACKICKPK